MTQHEMIPDTAPRGLKTWLWIAGVVSIVMGGACNTLSLCGDPRHRACDRRNPSCLRGLGTGQGFCNAAEREFVLERAFRSYGHGGRGSFCWHGRCKGS